MRPDDLARVEAVLAKTAISDLAFRPLAALSGGQRQIVSLAQTLVRDPDIALLDEPTSALDLSRQIAVLSHVRQVA
ncbi:ABC transporter ATP-binding protein, partial [Acinetobacter baumannii]